MQINSFTAGAQVWICNVAGCLNVRIREKHFRREGICRRNCFSHRGRCIDRVKMMHASFSVYKFSDHIIFTSRLRKEWVAVKRIFFFLFQNVGNNFDISAVYMATESNSSSCKWRKKLTNHKIYLALEGQGKILVKRLEVTFKSETQHGLSFIPCGHDTENNKERTSNTANILTHPKIIPAFFLDNGDWQVKWQIKSTSCIIKKK